MNKHIALCWLMLFASPALSLAQSKKEMKEEIVRLKEQLTQLTTENETLEEAGRLAQAQAEKLSAEIAPLRQELATVDFRIQELLRENEALRGQISAKTQRKLKKRSQEAQQQPKAQ